MGLSFVLGYVDVSEPAHRLDDGWLAWVLFNLAAQTRNANINAAIERVPRAIVRLFQDLDISYVKALHGGQKYEWFGSIGWDDEIEVQAVVENMTEKDAAAKVSRVLKKKLRTENIEVLLGIIHPT